MFSVHFRPSVCLSLRGEGIEIRESKRDKEREREKEIESEKNIKQNYIAEHILISLKCVSNRRHFETTKVIAESLNGQLIFICLQSINTKWQKQLLHYI